MTENCGLSMNSAAVVTGASSGIGRAIALSLARHGVAVYAVGRDAARLSETVAAAQPDGRVVPFQTDLALDENIAQLERLVTREFGRLDILVHSAGVVQHDPMRDARVEGLDHQYAVNVRAPYLLTKSFLPALKSCRGQIVFVNSSLGVSVKRPEVGQFAATQYAMKAIADSLREELNPDGIRVLTVYPGRTATPRQERLYQQEGKAYRPELLMQPEDIAAMVTSALRLPRTAEVTDIHMRPMQKSYS
jgi:NADP-dependent 3-hydroxy acid dehydrogenase YdfG